MRETLAALAGLFEPGVVEAIDRLQAAELPAYLAVLAALQARLAARLAKAAVNQAAPPDRFLTVTEAASLVGMSEDWLYRHAARLPFTRRNGRRALRFSEQGIHRYLAAHRP